jgi:hypothetical protein
MQRQPMFDDLRQQASTGNEPRYASSGDGDFPA